MLGVSAFNCPVAGGRLEEVGEDATVIGESDGVMEGDHFGESHQFSFYVSSFSTSSCTYKLPSTNKLKFNYINREP